MADTLDEATGNLLNNDKSPKRKCGELDNRGSHFYIAMYWALALAAQTKDAGLQERFAKLAKALEANEAKIIEEMLAVQGEPADIGGYFRSDEATVTAVMRAPFLMPTCSHPCRSGFLSRDRTPSEHQKPHPL